MDEQLNDLKPNNSELAETMIPTSWPLPVQHVASSLTGLTGSAGAWMLRYASYYKSTQNPSSQLFISMVVSCELKAFRVASCELEAFRINTCSVHKLQLLQTTRRIQHLDVQTMTW